MNTLAIIIIGVAVVDAIVVSVLSMRQIKRFDKACEEIKNIFKHQ